MPLTCSEYMVHVLMVYKEWFFKVERPLFMVEPSSTPSHEDLNNPGSKFFPNLPTESVPAGFPANLRLFIAISAQVCREVLG